MIAVGTMTQPKGWTICVFLAVEGDCDYKYTTYSSEFVARERAEQIAEALRNRRLSPSHKAVFIQDGSGGWETVGSVYDIPKQKVPA